MSACHYCAGPTFLVDAETLYPFRAKFVGRKFVKCEPCAAWALADEQGEPIGRIANVTLRAKRRRAYEAFEPLWKHGVARDTPEEIAKAGAYDFLARELGMSADNCRFNYFDEYDCDRAIEICNRVSEVLKERIAA